jgi:hypothetical protein
MVNSHSPRKPRESGFFPLFRLLLVLAAAGTLAMVSFSCRGSPATSNLAGSPRAAIIDQLYSLQPNADFTRLVTNSLEKAGYRVDCFKGDEITVDFYRRLPGYNYRLIIFRAHAGLLGGQGQALPWTCLFSNEPYSETAHINEQLSDRLAKARTDEGHPWVFGIGNRFVARSMEGQFNRTVIIMMGCSTLYVDDLARAFIEKGAAAYLGWDATIGLDYVDDATIDLVHGLLGYQLSIQDSSAQVLKDNGPDPTWGAGLKYYPLSAGKETLSGLLKPPQ